MIIQANSFPGYLDISAPEVLGSTGLEWLGAAAQYRHAVKTGDVLFLPDEYLRFPNILNAVGLGMLTVVSYDSRPESIVINAELTGGGAGATKYVFLDIHGAADTALIKKVNGTPFLEFPPKVESRSAWVVTIPADYKTGTNLVVEVYWSGNLPGGGGNARWVLEYKSVASGASLTLPLLTSTFVQPAPATANRLVTTGTALSISGGALAANALLTLSVRRDGKDPSDTYVGNAQLHLARISYTAN